MKKETLIELIRFFIFLAFACMLGSFLGNLLFDATRPEPVVVNVILKTSPDTDASVVIPYDEPSTSEPKAEPQMITGDFDILSSCGYTKEQLVYALSDGGRETMIPYVDSLLKAEETYGVNAFYLMCKFGLESGWASCMSGANNIGGWTNYDGSYRDFSSVDDCIMYISRNLVSQYSTSVGTRLEDVCGLYSPNDQYLTTLMGIMSDRQAKINEVMSGDLLL